MSDLVGVVYLLHFSEPFYHCRHYIGFCEKYENLDSRFEYHTNGRGSKLLAAITENGITFKLARLWTGTRDQERALKRRHNARLYCPECSAVPRVARGFTDMDL